MNSSIFKDVVLLALLYLGCGLLVVAYVNFYPLYEHLVQYFGRSFISYASYVPLVLILLSSSALFTLRPFPVKWRWLLPGILLCIIALFIPDSAIAVKRIHVTEYLLLSLLARYTMSHRLTAGSLLLFSSLFPAVLGIHDEFLQGIHPSRTYGLRDMLVNAVAATGGSFIWHSLALFTANYRESTPGGKAGTIHLLYLCWLAVAILAMVVPLPVYRHSPLPFWPGLPLMAAIVFWLCLLRQDDSELSHGIKAVSAAAFLLLIYPLVINSRQVSFF